MTPVELGARGLLLARFCDEDVGSLLDEEFGRSETYSRGAISDDRRFSL
jgi:hypothetical protein